MGGPHSRHWNSIILHAGPEIVLFAEHSYGAQPRIYDPRTRFGSNSTSLYRRLAFGLRKPLVDGTA
jgi:hypothetical protein